MGISLITILVGSFVYRLENQVLLLKVAALLHLLRQGPAGMNNVGMMMQRLESAPNDLEALLFLGEHFLGIESWQQAAVFLQRAVIAGPSETRPLYLLGISQYHAEQYQEAAASFERLLTMNDDPAARYNLGLLYMHYLNDRAKAKEHLNAVISSPSATEDLRAMAADALK